ncbi:hypothetical protein BLOT_009592 [Blomia tropicalis]|nr:hypothetical protein BLOT_009592 [Blomia tropicalis]
MQTGFDGNQNDLFLYGCVACLGVICGFIIAFLISKLNQVLHLADNQQSGRNLSRHRTSRFSNIFSGFSTINTKPKKKGHDKKYVRTKR